MVEKCTQTLTKVSYENSPVPDEKSRVAYDDLTEDFVSNDLDPMARLQFPGGLQPPRRLSVEKIQALALIEEASAFQMVLLQIQLLFQGRFLLQNHPHNF